MSNNSDADTMMPPQKKRGGVSETLQVALPMALSMSFDTLMTFVDRIYLSQLGSEQMNAALAGGTAQFMLQTFFIGLTGYSSAMVAQNLGAGKLWRCAPTLAQAVWVALLAYPILLLLKPIVYLMFDRAGIDPVQLAPQIQYFDILIYGSFLGLLRHTFGCFFSGIGETRVVMQASFVGLLVNCGMNYVLIFGKFGFPALGIRGAALGTLFAGLVILGILASRFFCRKYRDRFGTTHCWTFHRNLFVLLVRKGAPSGLEMLLNLLAFQCMILIFQGQGQAVATAATIMFTWDSMSFMPLIGLEIASASLVGRYVGARDMAAAQRTSRSGVKLGLIYSVVVLIAFVGFPHYLVDLFRPDPVDASFLAGKDLATFLVRLVAVYLTTESIMVVYSGALRGAGDTFWVLCAMVSLQWLLVFFLWFAMDVLRLNPGTT
ncbi:MAG TPA: MATE family efflux transporter, partial [Fibrobacteraceae bacterium]|nr:MATE family efflux transporter [Fibrobacteraceae bacterium]